MGKKTFLYIEPGTYFRNWHLCSLLQKHSKATPRWAIDWS